MTASTGSSAGTGLPWLAGLEGELSAQADSGQLAHALLLHGERGTGRRRLAAWLAQRILNSGSAVCRRNPRRKPPCTQTFTPPCPRRARPCRWSASAS